MFTRFKYIGAIVAMLSLVSVPIVMQAPVAQAELAPHCGLVRLAPDAGQEDESVGDYIDWGYGIVCNQGYALSQAHVWGTLWKCPDNGIHGIGCPKMTTGDPWTKVADPPAKDCYGDALGGCIQSRSHSPANDENTSCWFMHEGGNYTTADGLHHWILNPINVGGGTTN